MIRFTQAMIFVLCLCGGMALAQSEGIDPSPPDEPARIDLFPFSYSEMNGISKNFASPAKKTFFLNLWPKLVEVKGFYLEKPLDPGAAPAGLTDPGHPAWGSYFNLLATASGFGGKFVGEGEFAYSSLGFAAPGDQQPIMSRFSLRGSWGKTNYGLQHRSFGSGFVSLSGQKVEHRRDENQLWGEYDFGLFRLRGNLGEFWEQNSQSDEQTLTRAATTTVNVHQPHWSASLSSSYALSGQGTALATPTPAFTSALSMAYRPVRFISIEPGISFKQERDPLTGFKTHTPSWGLALISAPGRDFQFSSRLSYSRALSEDPLKEISTIASAAHLNWKIGKTFLGEQTLSFQLEYKNEISPNALTQLQPNLTGLLQWKIAGF